VGLGGVLARNARIWDAPQLAHDIGGKIPPERESDGRFGRVRACYMKLPARSQVCVDEDKQYLRGGAYRCTLDLHFALLCVILGSILSRGRARNAPFASPKLGDCCVFCSYGDVVARPSSSLGRTSALLAFEAEVGAPAV
jgi:hypothetical protein